MYKLLTMEQISIITCPKYEDVIEFTKKFDAKNYNKYFIYLEENHTIYYFNGKSIVCSNYEINDNKIHLQYESVWDEDLLGKGLKGERIGGTKIAHFSVLIIEIDDNYKIEKIEYAIDSLFWMGRLDNSQREREIIEVYESENYKRRYEFDNYMRSLYDNNINTVSYSKLTYKPKETLMDIWEKRKENK